MPATVVTEPARPTSVRASLHRHRLGAPGRARPRCRPPSPPAPAPRRSSGRRRSADAVRSAVRSRCRPTARRSTCVGADHELGRAAADVDDQVGGRPRNPGLARRRPAAGRADERQLAPPRRRSPPRAPPRRSRAPRRRTPAGWRRRGWRWWPPRGPRGAVLLDELARSSRIAANVRSSASGASRPVLSTPSPEPDDLHPPLDVDQLTGVRVDVGDQQAHRVGAAVDGGDPGASSPSGAAVTRRLTHGPSLHHSGQRIAAPRRPNGLTRAPAGARARPGRAGTSPGRACRRRSACRAAAAPALVRGGLVAARDVVVVRGPVRGGQLGIRRPAGPASPHQPRGLQRADRGGRPGQVR